MSEESLELLTENDIKENLSRTYVTALATMAGFTTAVPRNDRDSVDLIISAGGRAHPKLSLQLKATSRLKRPRNGKYHLHSS